MLQRQTWETRQRELKRGDTRWVAQAGSQCLVLACPIYELLYHGTRGPGKTETMLIDFLKDVGRGFGSAWHGIVFRRTYPELSSIIKRSLSLIPQLFPGAKYNANDKEWRFPDGEYLRFRFISRTGEGGDYDKYHGWEIPWICFEELCTWPTSELFLKMQSCCRSSDERVGPIARIRATANPLGVGHSWVKKRYGLGGSNHTRVIQDGELKRCAIFGHLEENKIMLRSDPQYKAKLLASCKGNPAYVKAWLYGSWDVTAGGMFDDLWDPKIHVVEPIIVPPSTWRLDRSFDWGSSAPFSVGFWAQSDGSDYEDANGDCHATVRGDLYRIGEWYGCDPEESNVGLRMHSHDIAAGIVERELAMGHHDRMLPGPADPSIFTETDGKSYATVMGQLVRVGGRQFKGPTFTRADNSRVPGWERVRTMLANAKPGAEGMREHPGLFVTRNCAKFQELFPVTMRDPIKPDDVDCFVAGTQVETADGPVPIERVAPGTLVHTPIGLRRVTRANLSGMSPTVRVKLHGGVEIEGTPDHRVFVEGQGLVPLMDLKPGMALTSNVIAIGDAEWESESSNTTGLGTPDRPEGTTTRHPDVCSPAEPLRCIDRSGSITMDPSRRGTTSTTETATSTTTRSITCNAYPHRNTRVIISRNVAPQARCGAGTQRGSQPRSHEICCVTTLERCVRERPLENLRALIVGCMLKPGTPIRPLAPSGAKLRLGTSETGGCAQSAETSSPGRKPPTGPHKLVVTSVVGCFGYKKPVYNLTVEQAHLYYANGCLVTNTDSEDHLQDDVRYRCKSASLGVVRDGRVAGPAGDVQRARPAGVRRGRVTWR